MGFQWISTTNLNWRFHPSTVGVDKVECASRYVRWYPLLKDMREKPCNVFFFWGGAMDDFDGFSMPRVFLANDLLDATI